MAVANDNTGDTSSAQLSIGAVSKATGIPADTLRTWERRYGFPTPVRSASGHRLYTVETTERLQLIARALEYGHRVSQLVELDAAQIARLLDSSTSDAADAIETPAQDKEAGEPISDILERWLEAVEALDESRLKSFMQHAWSRHGAVRCLQERIAPFLKALGRAWETGRLRVFHEHFASECVREFLSKHWRTLAEYNTGPLVVLTTLPGEEHNLGLHMAACVLALAGVQIVFLGANTPLEDILPSARQSGSVAIAISVSYGVHSATVRRYLNHLEHAADEGIIVAVGGGGMESIPEKVERLDSLEDALNWAQRLVRDKEDAA